MVTEGQNKEFAPQQNEGNVATSHRNREVVKKTLEECLLDSHQETNELFELYNSAQESFIDFRNLIDEYEKGLKVLKEKRFHIRKPINTYMLEEKIDIFESGIDTYRRSSQKINKDIKERLEFLYDKRVPEEEIKKNEDRKKGFSKLHKDAIKELRNWKTFYQKILNTKK